MIEISKNAIQFRLVAPVRLHIDRARMRASNWVCIEGWIADLANGAIDVETIFGNANCLIIDRPDVCKALGIRSDIAFGFTLHLIFPICASSNTISATLVRKGAAIAVVQIDVQQTNLPPLPFASHKAIELTQRLYRDVQNGNGARDSDRVTLLDSGVLATTNTPLPFDNTRVGNYHPDVLKILNKPGIVALDMGCGIRDTVFDNLVTQDIYLTPTATLITAPGDIRLPFNNETFDLIILDSVLEHVPDPIIILQEGYRLLKPGGRIFGDAPFLQPLHLLPHHYFNFTPFGLEVAAKKAGLMLEYVAAEAHQRPEFTLEWLLRRIFETVSSAESIRLKNMTVDAFYTGLVHNKKLIDLPAEAITEMAAGYRFHMAKPVDLGGQPEPQLLR